VNAGIVQNGFSNLVGNSLGPIVLVYIATRLFTWREAFFLAAIPGFLCAIAIWLWVKEPAREAHHEDGHGASMGLVQMLKVRNVLICSLLSIFMVAWLVTGFAFLPTFLVEYRRMSPEAMAGIMSILGFCAFLGGALLPWISDRLGRRPVVVTCAFVSVLAPLAALYAPGSTWIVGGLMFIGWVGNCIFPLFMGTIPGESLPRRHIATAMGIVVGVGEVIGGVFGPIIAGRIADLTPLGQQAPMWTMAVCSIIGGVLALFLTETAPAKVGVAAAARQPAARAA
jgi:predicted MFS family arabinose efflux permease